MVYVLPRSYFLLNPFYSLFFVGELEKSQLTAKEDSEKIRSLEGTMWLKSFLPSVISTCTCTVMASYLTEVSL